MKQKMKLVIVMAFLAANITVLFQNCGQSSNTFSGGDDSINTSSSFAEEDDIWFRLESARIKIKQLNAIDGFSDMVSQEVLEGQTPKGLAAALQQDVDKLNEMILDQNIPTNSSDVIKKYTSLIDLLSKARDMLLAYYMNIGFDQVAKNLDEAKVKLESSISLLSSSHQALELSHSRLQLDVEGQGAEIRALRIEMKNKIDELNAKMDQKIQRLQAKIERTIFLLNIDLMARIAENSMAIDRQGLEINDLDARMSEIEDKVKPQVEYLVRLSEETRKELDDFAVAFEELRLAGNETYSSTLDNWSCSEDLIDRNGQQFLNLSANVSEMCSISKEDTLYAICVERYPTFCGQCQGQEMDQCEHWNNPQTGLTAREKLEILINIRQEIAIEHLAQQTEIQRQAIYGSNSCNRERMNLVDGQLQNSCTVSDLNQCGIEGKLLALHLVDQDSQAQIAGLSSSVNERMTLLEGNFEKAREYSNQRFAEMQSYVDEQLNKLESVMNSRFAQVASALSGMPFVSPSIKDEVDTLSAESAIAEEKAAVSKALIGSSLARIPGFDHLSAHQINLIIESDVEGVLKVISEGAIGRNGAVGSLSSVMISLMRNTFENLNADQNNIASYNDRLLAMVGGVCPADVIGQSPYANVLGRDSMEIIAIGAARRVVLGDGASQVAGINVPFRNYQNSLVRGGRLQQAFFSSAFDYRRDVTISVSADCLNAVEAFAQEVLSNDYKIDGDDQGATVAHIFNDADLMADLLAIHEQTSLVMVKLAQMEETILSRAVIDTDSDEFKDALMDLALRLIDAGTSRIVAKIKSSELEGLLLAQRNTADSGFQNQFDRAINEYISQKHKMAATIDELMGDVTILQQEMVEVQQNQSALQDQMKKLGAAVGFLQAEMRLEKLKNQKMFDDLKKQIADITRQIEEGGVGAQFDPKILAVRHSFDNTKSCTLGKLSAVAFPTSNQFVGGYLICDVNFRRWQGDGRTRYWAFGINNIQNMWFKIWGSATDIDVALTISGQNKSASLNVHGLQVGERSDQGAHKVVVTKGNSESGAFMLNVPSLFSGINTSSSSFNQQVRFTPRNRFNDKRGSTVTYS
ncbi:MAG: hypothetical protein HRT44_03090, partial [Bdellovibrionales bacterium]|nr:hypothetical protein [Bdellovibrionales bacterium]